MLLTELAKVGSQSAKLLPPGRLVLTGWPCALAGHARPDVEASSSSCQAHDRGPRNAAPQLARSGPVGRLTNAVWQFFEGDGTGDGMVDSSGDGERPVSSSG